MEVFMRLMIVMSLALFSTMSSALANDAENRRTARRSPVVEVFEASRDAVVNISSKEIVSVRDPFGGIFEDFFDIGRPPGFGPRLPGGPMGERQYTRTSVGSGFVIHRDGYIVTNAHVVAQTAERKVTFADGGEFDAEIIAFDTDRDVAILKIDAGKPLPTLQLGRSNDLMIGETVIAIGNPLGYQNTVTAGVVSAIARDLHFGRQRTLSGLIQTDASINPGNSGGPLLNVLGELIGINTAIRGDAQNIGFAIPVDALRKLLPEMLSIEHGPKRLEVGLRLSWRNRLYVVEARGPAAEAGIEAGDEVISIAGMPLKNDVDYYVYCLRIAPEDRVVVEIKRDGKLMQKIITPKTIPIPDGAKLLREKFGFEVQLLTKEQAEQLDLKAGLIITDVEPNSPAAQAGFERNLVVVQVGQHFPSTLEEIALLLENVQSGDKLMFRVYRIQRDFLRVYAVALAAR